MSGRGCHRGWVIVCHSMCDHVYACAYICKDISINIEFVYIDVIQSFVDWCLCQIDVYTYIHNMFVMMKYDETMNGPKRAPGIDL